MLRLLTHALVAVALVTHTGCQGPYQRDLAPTTDRMMATYDDLVTKRFEVLADFESAKQGTLFRLEPPGGAGAVGVSTERALTQTGVGSLRLMLTDASESVVAADSYSSEWGLYRDWSSYHLLLFNIFSPRSHEGLRVQVTSGSGQQYNHSPIPLQPEWNLIRIDLGDARDLIDLRDVREISFRCDPLDEPIELYLDDLILADNAQDVFGFVEGDSDPKPQAGDLYVRTLGRRLVVGARDRFELAFSRGRIVGWYDLEDDPLRTRNLAWPGTLSPVVVIRHHESEDTVDVDDLSRWAGMGQVVEVHQGLQDPTPLHVIVQGEWRFGSVESPPVDTSPYHRWIHTIYADGRIYVECSGMSGRPDQEPALLGITFCCNGSLGFQRKVFNGTPASVGQTVSGPPYVLFTRPESDLADLLVVPFGTGPLRMLKNDADPRRCLLYELPGARQQFSFASMLRVWPRDIDSPSQAGPMATDYGQPLPISVEAGQLVDTDDGDLDSDGFNETRGYYVLQLEGNMARIRLDGHRTMRFSPVFKLVHVQDRNVWVYANGKQIKGVYRDPDDNALFAVPGVISKALLLEITARARDADIQ